MSTAVQSCPLDPCPQLSADKLRVAELQDEAKLAGAVYDDPEARKLPEGYSEIRKEKELNEMGLSMKDLEPEDSGFRAAVFKKKDGKVVVAFKGTTMTSLEDWKNNAAQELKGKSDYYTRAQAISYELMESKVDNVSFTGHSLGGGLASAAARRSGKSASTFNAAGLNPKTLEDRPGGGHIDRVYVKGDIVTSIQIGPASKAASDKDWAIDPPKGIGARVKRALATGVGKLVGGWLGGFAGPIGAKVGSAGGGAAARGVMLHLMDSVDDSLQQKMESLQKEHSEKCG
ncbi:MAG: DUF2974 domain-containing protein [Hellea sp.]|nr:DUF2974 domain-containing protein [Hellea sp.]